MTVSKLFRDNVLRMATAPGMRRLWQPWYEGSAPILMYHRFASLSIGNRGFALKELRRQLALLRRRRHTVLPLTELLERAERGARDLHRCLAITVDDGYADFEEAADVFDEFDCPTTVFLTTGFLDGNAWMWWDRVEHAFLGTKQTACDFTVAGEQVRSALRTVESRLQTAEFCFEILKRPPTEQKLAEVVRIEEMLGVDVAASPTINYQALSWEQVRALELRGHRFGPHTVTHPILARSGSDAARREIERSWTRLTEEVQYPVPVFCYPNGDVTSFGEREEEVLREIGLRWAVTTERGYLRKPHGPSGQWRVPRFSAPETSLDLQQVITGFEAVKRVVRGK